MSKFGHAMKHVGFFGLGSGATAATVGCGAATVGCGAVTGVFYLATVATLGITRPLYSLGVLATAGCVAGTVGSAVGAAASFNYAFSHH